MDVIALFRFCPRRAPSKVVLQHAASGTVFPAPAGEGPMLFACEADAAAFRDRFLDEGPAWEPLPRTRARTAA